MRKLLFLFIAALMFSAPAMGQHIPCHPQLMYEWCPFGTDVPLYYPKKGKKPVIKTSLENRIPEPGTPVALSGKAEDISGTYKGKGHYTDVVITSRGGEYLVTTRVAYSNMTIPADAIIRASGEGSYDSIKGSIYAGYGSYDCKYPFSMHLSYKDGKIWLSERGPSCLPGSYSGCPPQSSLRYGDYVEKEVYTRAK